MGAQIFNNTFYNCGMGDSFDGAIDNDGSEVTAAAATIVNNIVWPASGVLVSNLWNGASNAPTGDGNVSGDPSFVAAGSNFALMTGSPAKGTGSSVVSGLVTTNYDLVPWGGGPYDIGAF